MIATIETAIVETIRAARLPYLRYLGTYGGELDGEPQSIVRQTPAVWVSYRDESAPDPRNTGRTRWTVKATFSVLAAARSLKNEEATRHGDAVQVGSYQMIEDVRALIGFNDFGLSGVDYLRPGRTRTLFNGRLAACGMSILMQEWTALYDLRVREPGQRALDPPRAPYLPPEAPGLPAAAHAKDAVDLPPLSGFALRYWLKSPLDPDTDEPSAVDLITLNINRADGSRGL
jgi:phage gp37-like protein